MGVEYVVPSKLIVYLVLTIFLINSIPGNVVVNFYDRNATTFTGYRLGDVRDYATGRNRWIWLN